MHGSAIWRDNKGEQARCLLHLSAMRQQLNLANPSHVQASGALHMPLFEIELTNDDHAIMHALVMAMMSVESVIPNDAKVTITSAS